MRIATILLLAAFSSLVSASHADEWLALHARRSIETAPNSGRFHSVETPTQWKASETAIIVCDMWDRHWCRGATARVAEMAPRMNEVLKAARARGVLIIHCPSECMKFYDGSPERKLAQAAPVVKLAKPVTGWQPLDSGRERPLPIDDSDGGCDCDPPCQQAMPWTREIATLEMEPGDAVTDSAEAIYLMRQRGVKNAIVMGVHANMCVLGRPFAIRQLVGQGMNVVLMRDMTDTMYNSRSAPHVSHFSGADLIVEHIERYWCPTVASADFTNKGEFRFAADHRPHAAIVMAEDEYDTARTLTEFARTTLQKDYRLTFIYGSERERNDIPGIDAARSADVIILSIRRRLLPTDQLTVFREHVAQGKAVVAIRTSSHAFAPSAEKTVPTGHEAWLEFDHDVLGGNYHGHYGREGDQADGALIQSIQKMHAHPILSGIPAKEFAVRSWLYKTSPLAPTAIPLILGRVQGHDEREPVAWTHQVGKSKVFYISLGHPDDFQLPEFRQLLENAVRWATSNEASHE